MNWKAADKEKGKVKDGQWMDGVREVWHGILPAIVQGMLLTETRFARADDTLPPGGAPDEPEPGPRMGRQSAGKWSAADKAAW